MGEKKTCPACGGAMEYERLVRMTGDPWEEKGFFGRRKKPDWEK